MSNTIALQSTMTPAQYKIAEAKYVKKEKQLKSAAAGFESYFLDSLFKEMRKTVPEDESVKDDAHQQQTFQDMMDQKVADTVSKRGDFGIGAMLYKQLANTLGPAPIDPSIAVGPNVSTQTKIISKIRR